jgi:heme/copper-type cytochrome/quinol oxidase subunit 2
MKMTGLIEILASTQQSLLWICAIVAVLVFVAMVYSTVTFRADNSAHDSAGNSAHNSAGRARHVAREFAWALVPIFIVVAAAAPAMRNAIPTHADRSLLTENLENSPCTSVHLSSESRVVQASNASCSKHP